MTSQGLSDPSRVSLPACQQTCGKMKGQQQRRPANQQPAKPLCGADLLARFTVHCLWWPVRKATIQVWLQVDRGWRESRLSAVSSVVLHSDQKSRPSQSARVRHEHCLSAWPLPDRHGPGSVGRLGVQSQLGGCRCVQGSFANAASVARLLRGLAPDFSKLIDLQWLDMGSFSSAFCVATWHLPLGKEFEKRPTPKRTAGL